MEKYSVLIVEDEKAARDGIVNAIERDAPDFRVAGVAADGLEALEALRREKPDIVVTDIAMPRMNGLEMIEVLRCEHPETHAVIVSGYDDFSYAQQALRYGVKDYLLKPVASAQLIAVLERLKGELRSWRRYGEFGPEIAAALRGSVPLHRERFLIDLLTGSADPAGVREASAALGVDDRAGYYCVVLFRCFEASGAPGSELKRKAHADLILSELAEDLLPLGVGHYAAALESGLVALVLAARDLTRNDLFLVIEQKTQLIISGLRRHAGLQIHAGIGRVYKDLLQLSASYGEAAEAMDYCYLRDGSAVVNYADLTASLAPGAARPARLEEAFIVGVKTCDRALVARAVDDLGAFYRDGGALDPRSVRADLLEIFSRLFERLGAKGPDADPALAEARLAAADEIARRLSLGDLLSWTREHALRVVDALDRAGSAARSSRIKKVRELVELNLASPGLVLDDVAAQVYLSPNYLRVLFKQETGESFVEYLTRSRMEKAAALLSDTRMRVQEVAEAVGYPNQRYFAQCFKKAYSLAPTEFRLYGNGADLRKLDTPQ